MPSYLVTGASRGLGLEFVRQFSSDPNNTVIGLVRDKTRTEKTVSESEELKSRSNIHFVQADLTHYDALKSSVDEVAKITGGSLDYLIANAGHVSHWDAYDGIGVLGTKAPLELEEELMKCFKINVVSNIHLFNLHLPLILKGQVKKVIAMSTGQADIEVINKFELDVAALYAISKAALNMAISKFNAQYKKDGVLFMSICPGMVETGHYADATPEQLQSLGGMLGKFVEYAPHFKGPSTPEAAIADVIKVINNATLEKDGGAYVSHYGNKQWL